MAEPPKYSRDGPPGGLPGNQEWAGQYNKAAQAKQKEIFERQQAAKQAALNKAGDQVAPKEQFQPAAQEITKQKGAERGS